MSLRGSAPKFCRFIPSPSPATIGAWASLPHPGCEAPARGTVLPGRQRTAMRVAREWLAAEGGLPVVLANAVLVLVGLDEGIAEAWCDPAGVRELAGQVNAIVACLASHSDALAQEMLATLLRLRLNSVCLLNELGDSTGLAILAAEPLVIDCERLLGADHPDTLASRNNLALAYQAAGRTAKAIPLLERALADCKQVLGADQPTTVIVRRNLAGLIGKPALDKGEWLRS